MRGMLLALQRAYTKHALVNRAGSEGGSTYGDELLVLGVRAVVGEHGEESFLSVEALANLVESFDESYNMQTGEFKHAINPRVDPAQGSIKKNCADAYRRWPGTF